MTPLSTAPLAMSGPEDRGEVAPQLAERSLVVGIDRYLDAHACAQWRVVRGLIEKKANRYALHDFHPIACGILRRQ
jgi:hypothetical protein